MQFYPYQTKPKGWGGWPGSQQKWMEDLAEICKWVSKEMGFVKDLTIIQDFCLFFSPTKLSMTVETVIISRSESVASDELARSLRSESQAAIDAPLIELTEVEKIQETGKCLIQFHTINLQIHVFSQFFRIEIEKIINSHSAIQFSTCLTLSDRSYHLNR